jgi:hypothetical protein
MARLLGVRDKVSRLLLSTFINVHGEAVVGMAVTPPSAPLGGMGKDAANAAMPRLLSGNRRPEPSKVSMMCNMLS